MPVPMFTENQLAEVRGSAGLLAEVSEVTYDGVKLRTILRQPCWYLELGHCRAMSASLQLTSTDGSMACGLVPKARLKGGKSFIAPVPVIVATSHDPRAIPRDGVSILVGNFGKLLLSNTLLTHQASVLCRAFLFSESASPSVGLPTLQQLCKAQMTHAQWLT